MVLKVTVQKQSLKQSLRKVSSGAAVRRFSLKLVFLKIGNIHSKTPVLESLYNKQTPTQVFFVNISKNSTFYRIPAVAPFVSLIKQLFSIGHLLTFSS